MVIKQTLRMVGAILLTFFNLTVELSILAAMLSVVLGVMGLAFGVSMQLICQGILGLFVLAVILPPVMYCCVVAALLIGVID